MIAFYRSLSFIERQMKRFPDDPHQQNAVQRWLYSRIVTFLLAGGHVETLPEYMGGRQSEMDAALGNLTPQQLQDAFPVGLWASHDAQLPASGSGSPISHLHLQIIPK